MQQYLFRKFFPKLKQFETSRKNIASNNVALEGHEIAIGRIYKHFAVTCNTAGQRQGYAYLFATPAPFIPIVTKHLETRVKNAVFLSLDELDEWRTLNENDVDSGADYLWCQESTWSVDGSPYTNYRESFFREPEFGTDIPKDARPLISIRRTTSITGRRTTRAELWALKGDTLLGPDFFGEIGCS